MSAAQLNHPVGGPGDLSVVGYHQNCAFGGCLTDEQFENLCAGPKIKLSRRLVR